MTSEQALPALPQTMALWRMEKLPQAELKARLRAAGLSEVGTKRLLAQRLQSHLQTQPPPSSESSGEESSSEEEKSEETDSGEKRPRRKRTRRSPAPVRLSRSDLKSVKTLLRRHARKRSRSTRSATASSSYSDSSRESSSSAPSSSALVPPPRPPAPPIRAPPPGPAADTATAASRERVRDTATGITGTTDTTEAGATAAATGTADGSRGRLEFYLPFPTGSRVGSGGVSLLSCMFYCKPTSLGLPGSTRGARMTKVRSAQLP